MREIADPIAPLAEHHTADNSSAQPISSSVREVEGYYNVVIILGICAGIAAIAYVDSVVITVSLGFLYLFPLAVSPLVMRLRWSMQLVLLCVFLHDFFGPYEHSGWQVVARNVVSFAGYTSAVIAVDRMVRQRMQLAETLRLQRDELAREIAQAALIQRSMLPKLAPQYNGIELAARMEPAKVVAGDYYDYIELEDDNLGLIVADVSGKGVPAGLLMPTVKAALLLEAPRSHQSFAVAASLNQLIHDVTDGARFVTMFYANLNPREKTIKYTNCGHLPALWYKAATKEVVWLDKGGIALGMFAAMKFEDEEVHLNRGDILAIYSDGIVEAEDRFGDEFTRERLAEIVYTNVTLSADELIDAIFAAVADFTESQPPADDQTMMVLKVE